MAEVFSGTLVFKGQGKDRRCFLNYTSKKAKPMNEPINPDKIAPPLREPLEAEIKVDFELDESGRPFRVRPAGAEWKESVPQPALLEQNYRARNEEGRRDDRSRSRYDERRFAGRSQYQTERKTSRSYGPGDFHNPYNFIPAPPPRIHSSSGDTITRAAGRSRRRYLP